MDKTYNVAIIGCGGISHMHTRWYLNEPRATLCAVADVAPEHMKAYSEKYGIDKQYTDYIEMLETEEIDIVSVCTRPKLHAPIVIETAKRGVKGILSEKPMAENLGQAQAMLEACSQHGVKLAIDHQTRFSDAYVTAKQMIADGLIGELFRIHGICGEGDLKDNATHTVDIMRFLYGDCPVIWVMGQIEHIGTPMNYDLHSEISRSVTSSLRTMFGALLNRAPIPHRVTTTSTATGQKAKSNSLFRTDRFSVSATRSPVEHG